MVAFDDSHAHAYLLRGSLGSCRSDDVGNIEILFDPEVSSEPVEKPDLGRTRFLRQLRQKIAKRVRSIGTKSKKTSIFDYDEDKENFFTTASPGTTNLSTYDQSSILESRDGHPFDESELHETFTTVSSALSTTSNQKSQRRLITDWKNCMRSSVRKLLGKEKEDEMKGRPPKYQEFGLHLYPEDSIFNISKDRKRSAFELLVPTLDTPAVSRDEVSNAGQYSNDDNFPLKSLYEIAVEEAMHQIEVQAKDLQRPTLQPTKSSLFVSFGDDMAQLIFNAPSSDTKDFQAVELQSVKSDIETLSDNEDPFTVTFPANAGAEYSRPGVPTVVQCSSSETEGSPRPLGITYSHPNWRAYQQRKEQHEVWNRMEAPLMDGEITDPPSPTRIKTSQNDYWGLGQVSSTESDLTMTDVLLNKHGCFPTDFSALPEIPLPRYLLEKYPFDEESDRDDEPDYGIARRRPEQAVSISIEHLLTRGALAAFATERDQEQHTRGRVHGERVKCGCVKCTAKSIYQDLLDCHGGSVD